MVVDGDGAEGALVGEGVAVVEGVRDGLSQGVGEEDVVGVAVLADPEVGEIFSLDEGRDLRVEN